MSAPTEAAESVDTACASPACCFQLIQAASTAASRKHVLRRPTPTTVAMTARLEFTGGLPVVPVDSRPFSVVTPLAGGVVVGSGSSPVVTVDLPEMVAVALGLGVVGVSVGVGSGKPVMEEDEATEEEEAAAEEDE